MKSLNKPARLHCPERAISKFMAFYKEELGKTALAVPKGPITVAADQIRSFTQRERAILYLFGNGGSCAILRHLDLAMRETFANASHGIRVTHGIEPHLSSWIMQRESYLDTFVRRLEDEHADGRDLVVLMSGSGDSDNILKAAEYCRRMRIPTLSFAGFDGGKLSQGLTDNAIVGRIADQQICEDAIQWLLHPIVQLAGGSISIEDRVDFVLESMKCLERVLPSQLCAIGHAIVSAWFDSGAVFTVAPEGGALSSAAEHVAHNLNWDAVFELDNPPNRVIHSTPTSADFSGIGNDRMKKSIVIRQQLHKAKQGDVLVVFAQDRVSEVVRNTVEAGENKGMRIFVLAGNEIGSTNYFATANILQSLGHMIGRVARANMKLRLGVCTVADAESILINEDMAQRRLLYEKEEP